MVAILLHVVVLELKLPGAAEIDLTISLSNLRFFIDHAAASPFTAAQLADVLCQRS